MPDYHKCTNETCKLKENCLRWTEKASLMKSYIRFQPRKTDCEYQIKRDKMRKEQTKCNGTKKVMIDFWANLFAKSIENAIKTGKIKK